MTLKTNTISMTDQAIKKNDPENMLGRVLAWPESFEQGYQTAVKLPPRLKGAKQIVVCGMGGSAIGAGLAGGYLAGSLTVPYIVNRDYTLPAFVGSDTLVICVSHSGGTEETLSCYHEAQKRKAKILVVTTGGELAKLAKQDKVPCLKFTAPGQPRAALPVTLGLLLKLLSTLGYAPDQSAPAGLAAAHLRELATNVRQTERNLAATVADALVGKIPIIYGAGFLSEAARRFKGQISENGKQTAAWEALPEQNHNALVGYEFPKALPDQAVFVLLRSSFEHPQHTLRFNFVKELLERRHLALVEIPGTGPDTLSHLLSVLFWGDLASVDLAYRNGIDPTPVDIINDLKDRLDEESP